MYYLRKFPPTDTNLNERVLSDLFKEFTKNRKYLDINKAHIPQLKAALETGDMDTVVNTIEKINPSILDFSEQGNSSGNQHFILLPLWALVILVICLIIIHG